MSLLRTIALRAPRAPLAATASKPVRFSTSQFQQKDAGSAVKDTIDSVNKTVGEAAVKGIEKGRKLYASLKSLNSTQCCGPPSLTRAILHLLNTLPSRACYPSH